MSFISNLFSKQNLLSILAIALLVLTIGILFWYGEKTVKNAENVNTTILAWENLSTSHPLCPTSPKVTSNKYRSQNSKNENLGGFLCENSNLNLIIQNTTSKKIAYKIEWLVNDEVIDSKIITLGNTKEIITPTKEVLNKLISVINKTSVANNQNKLTSTTNINSTSKSTSTAKPTSIANNNVENSHKILYQTKITWGKHHQEILGKWVK